MGWVGAGLGAGSLKALLNLIGFISSSPCTFDYLATNGCNAVGLGCFLDLGVGRWSLSTGPFGNRCYSVSTRILLSFGM
jgi:hypothetical protein